MTRLIAASLVLVLSASSGSAQIVNNTPPADQRPTIRTMNCTEGGCHAKQTDFKFLHGPSAVKACEACHEYLDPAAHSFELKRKGRDLCEFCHIDKSGREGPVVHKPVETGDCTGCHNPHGASTRAMLNAASTPELCASCHKDTMNGSHKHGPAAADCTTCHKSHTSSHPHLLSMDAQNLCISCHEDVGKNAKNAKHPHDPAKSDCLKCHTPHASNQPRVLKLPVQELCASCHQKTVDSAAHAQHTHGALTDGKACMNCHVAHGSEFDKQLSQDPIASCLQCHAKPIEVSKDRVVKGVPEIGMANMHKHGAIEKGDCSGCHTVHGGQLDRLLVANYNNSFYQPYTEQAYELCFKCHSKELVMGNTDDPQTRFRDGTRNLHAIHVASDKNGRNCRSCHSIHASKFTQLINDTVPFGSWQLPINFIPNASGGSCSPGCHEPQKYQRTAPMSGDGSPLIPSPASSSGISPDRNPSTLPPTGSPAPSPSSAPAGSPPAANSDAGAR